jgi:hypothetical protein
MARLSLVKVDSAKAGWAKVDSAKVGSKKRDSAKGESATLASPTDSLLES